MFSFDQQFTMFDVTPVENQFILEYLPGARGDYVKVYLYGLMQCYHPAEALTVERMAEELGLTVDEIEAAYRHWERMRLVRRISDNPKAWQYLSVKQQFFTQPVSSIDQGYTDFAAALQNLFGSDRKLHGREIAQAYEWVEAIGLPAEVVLMMVQHLISTKKKSFSFKLGEKLAMHLAEEHVATIEDAEQVLSRDKAVYDGSRKITRRLGKLRNPSEDEQGLYRKWLQEWGFSHDAIEAACAETTKGEPTFAYLDGILKGMMRRSGRPFASAEEMQAAQDAQQPRVDGLKAVLRTMNARGLTINDTTLAAYDVMRSLYPDDVLLLAAEACAKSGNARLDAMLSLLQSWKAKHLQTASDVRDYLDGLQQIDLLTDSLYAVWELPPLHQANNRVLVRRWTEEYRFSREMIVRCAAFAKGKDKPMPYLDRLLGHLHAKGINDYEAAEAENQRFLSAAPAARPSARVLNAQNYAQRSYEDDANQADSWLISSLKEDADATEATD